MLSTITGSILIISGLAIALNPDRLRKRIRRKGVRPIKRVLIAIGLSAGALLLSIGWKYTGIIPKIIAGAGLVVILKVVYLAKAKSAEWINERLMTIPAIYIRLFAVGQIAVGATVIFFLRNQTS